MPDNEGIFDDLIGVVDNTPKMVAGIALGALLTLVLLKMGGFRFAFSGGAKLGK